ncbi:MAG: DNA photolyase [Acidobacteriota bacterium]|nr:DNA photolyase [Acidobacteriota bacterium]
MIRTVYVERAVRDHARAREILARLPGARLIEIERYGDVFNSHDQSFRVQKAAPALVLAEKVSRHVLAAPAGYGFPDRENFYFSHMLNCLYDCRYCFLQGMFASAHYVVFVNFADFTDAIERTLEGAAGPSAFFSGYDCDSLAFEGVTGFVRTLLPFFAEHPEACLELRSKSVAVDALLESDPLPNCVAAWSLSPPEVADALEHGAPSPGARLGAMARLAERGWPIGIRFDPLIYHQGYADHYRRFFAEVFERLPLSSVHSVSLGLFRRPSPFMKKLLRMYPEEPFLAAPLEDQDGVSSLRPELGDEMRAICTRALLEHVPESLLQPCFSGETP